MVALTRDDCNVDADIRRAETLPSAAFCDRGFLERELATIFSSSWLLVPELAGEDSRSLAEQVAARGARLPVSLMSRSLFLQRGWDDNELRLFPNTCTHAWHPLVLGASRGPTLVCGQHGRKFDCTGHFVSQQGFGKDLPDFPRQCDHLSPLGVATWRRLIFAQMRTEPLPSFAQAFAPIDDSLATLPDFDGRPTATVREIAGNWKLHAWNYLDRFHIGFVHRPPGGLADAIDLASYRTELYQHAVLQWAYAAEADTGFDPELLPPRFSDGSGRRVFALWWFVWPNLTLNFYPWGLSINSYMPIADRPDATRFHWLQWPLDPEKFAARDRLWLSAQVDAEDVDTLAQVNRGLRSGFAPRGRFAPDDEQAAHWFHRKVATAAFDEDTSNRGQ